MPSDPALRSIGTFLMAHQGQRDRKGGACADRTLHGHLPAMRGHHLHDIESQPVPPGFVVCSGSKISASFENAAAGIPHGEGHRRGLPSPLEGQCASLRHGVDRVVHQIHEHAPEAVGWSATRPSWSSASRRSVMPCAASAGGFRGHTASPALSRRACWSVEPRTRER